MSSTTAATQYTPEDLLRMPDGDRYELVNGNLLERNMSFWSSYIAGELHRLLSTHCREKKLGWVVPEGTSYQCFPQEPKMVRRADVSYLWPERLSSEQALEEGHLLLAPDLVAEVVSPNDLYYEVEDKVNEWLQAGVRLVWVVNPRTRQVRVFRANGTDVTLREQDELSGEDVVAGFRCRVGDLFLPPPGVASGA
jgi:Uma2 family endonuclease